MVSAADSRLGRTAAYLREQGPRFALEVAANFALPFLIYDLGSPRLGAVGALLAASTPPLAWSVAGFVRSRKLDAISLLVLSGMALSLLAFAGGGGVKALQLRENLPAGLVGLVFLGSAAIGRPLILQLSRAGARRRSADQARILDAIRDDRGFRDTMTAATLVWGFGLVAMCAVSCALVFAISIKRYLLVGPPVTYATMGALTAWTFWRVPREVRRALARQAASGTPREANSPEVG
jgi:hypothetical protein